jgi:fructose-1-phosphate kinase PfkB-like protein
MSTAVTQERLDAARAKLLRAIEDKEISIDPDTRTITEVTGPSTSSILELSISPLALLKLAEDGTQSLVISLTEKG